MEQSSSIAIIFLVEGTGTPVDSGALVDSGGIEVHRGQQSGVAPGGNWFPHWYFGWRKWTRFETRFRS